MASWQRITGVAGLAAGAAAAGAGAILAAERVAVGHVRAIRGAAEPQPRPLGSLRGRVLTVLADDGVPLHVEIDEPGTLDVPPDAVADSGDPVTIIFCHGYTLNQDSWHFQRLALGGSGLGGSDLDAYRLVFWDLRDHGRSGRSPGGPASIARLAADLDLVIKAVAPVDMPVVLVGHSMGGMTIMALAGRNPGLFGPKVIGAVLVSTAAGGLDAGSPWMPGPLRLVLQRTLPLVLRGAATGYRAILVERGRRVSSELAFLSTRYIGFGDPAVNPAVVDFLEQMILSTPINVVAEYSQALYEWDMRDTLPILGRVPVTVLVGERDRLISPALGLEVAAQIPGADLVWVPGAGHALILERPDLVNESITALVARATEGPVARERSA
jgi:pimeloyl-ACP methyl ester carboxylesterase